MCLPSVMVTMCFVPGTMEDRVSHSSPPEYRCEAIGLTDPLRGRHTTRTPYASCTEAPEYQVIVDTVQRSAKNYCSTHHRLFAFKYFCPCPKFAYSQMSPRFPKVVSQDAVANDGGYVQCKEGHMFHIGCFEFSPHPHQNNSTRYSFSRAFNRGHEGCSVAQIPSR